MEGQLLCGRYELTEHLGTDERGAHWTAHDRELDRTVAVTLLAEAELTPEDAERLEREVRTAVAVPPHPHLVAVHDFGRDESSLLVVTEHVRGRSLEQLMAAGEPPSPERAVDWVRQACAALAAAHAAGLVHQDLRPARLLLTEGGTVRLLGLGTAWLRPAQGPAGAARADSGLGSVPWMSPEQVRGDAPVDHRSDLYSIGCLLHQLLTGATPFGHREVTVQLGAHLRETPAPPSTHRAGLPADLDALVLRLLAKSPEERPESAAQTAALLAALAPQVAPVTTPAFPAAPASAFPAAATAPALSRPPAAAYTTDTPFGDFEPEQWWRRPSGRRAVLAAAGSALALALISGLVWTVSGHQGDGRQPVAAAGTGTAPGRDSASAAPFGTDPAPSAAGSPTGTTSAAPSGTSPSPGTAPSASAAPGTAGGSASPRPQGGPAPAATTTPPAGTAPGSTTAPAPQAPPSPPTGAAAYGCTGGLIDSYPVKTGAGVVLGYFYLYFDNATGTNCAATIKTANSGYGTASAVRASISRCSNTAPAASCTVVGGSTKSDEGSFTMYAGPVKVAAAGACVTGSGSITWAGVTATTAGSLGNRAVHCG
ncbi:protein kinase [Kitasatospora sp. NPDC094015]|uniref:serine/threonine-protein kinase n=1 Tax=Kitasatospora sp. NPDC094015 TaxID=3155205 RepID=UPI00332A7D2D